MQASTPEMRRSCFISLLRDPTQWPEGFKWDFSRCNSCGMGLLHRAYKLAEPWNTYNYTATTAEYLGLSHAVARSIFNPDMDEVHFDYHRPYPWVITANDLAQRLELEHRRIAAGLPEPKAKREEEFKQWPMRSSDLESRARAMVMFRDEARHISPEVWDLLMQRMSPHITNKQKMERILETVF